MGKLNKLKGKLTKKQNLGMFLSLLNDLAHDSLIKIDNEDDMYQISTYDFKYAIILENAFEGRVSVTLHMHYNVIDNDQLAISIY